MLPETGGREVGSQQGRRGILQSDADAGGHADQFVDDGCQFAVVALAH